MRHKQPDKAEDRIVLEFASLGITEVALLGRYNYQHAHPALKPHIHKNIFEICLLEHGTQTYVVGPTSYHLSGGDVFITRPGEVHGTGLEPENKGSLYWLELRIDEKERSFLGLTPQESRTLKRRFLTLSGRHFRNGSSLIPTFERILAAYAGKHNPLRIADVRNLVLRLVLDIIALAEHWSAPPSTIGIQNAIRHIEQNPTLSPGIAQLARIAHMSESYFKVSFRKEAGMPPGEYAMMRRIESAKQLLRSSNQPVTRLAMDLGFATSQHFATVFKRMTGLTPKAFRQRSYLPTRYETPSSGAGPRFHPVAK